MNRRTGTFQEFKEHTLAVARRERPVGPEDAKVWVERVDTGSRSGAGSQAAQPAPADETSSHYLHSVLRERIVEHVFVGEALRALWKRGLTDVEVLRSEFDAGGYDLVMSHGKVVRHIQFKSTTEFGKAARVSVSLKLSEKPSGCVIWIVVSPRELEIKSYRWFGDAPGKPLPAIAGLKPAKHTRANASTATKLERAGHRIVPAARFERLDSIDGVLDRLFGAYLG